MIDLNANPDAVFTLQTGDVVVVAGKQYEAAVETATFDYAIEIYLWRSECGGYKYVKTNDFSRIAWMSRQQLAALIKSGNFIAE